AIGTSYLTTLLIHREQVQQNYLVQHVTVFVLPHLGMGGSSLAQSLTSGDHRGMAMLYGMVQRQAMMLSFNDIYRMLCLLMVVMVPSFMFLRRDMRNVHVAVE
ncbi:MAG TPA: hypothetical protein VEJ86_03135, partial [Candidatus Binataceae bacterium]|nr:hypothetical protein [Candidatus Binataceae bacterium]